MALRDLLLGNCTLRRLDLRENQLAIGGNVSTAALLTGIGDGLSGNSFCGLKVLDLTHNGLKDDKMPMIKVAHGDPLLGNFHKVRLTDLCADRQVGLLF